MSEYIKSTNFTTKDTLPTGNANKIVKGTEIDTEFNAIANAITSKADLASPTFTGAPLAPTASAGTNTTQIATTAFVDTGIVNERSATVTLTNKTLTSPTINTAAISGGTITGLSTPLPVASGGTSVNTIAANAVMLGNGTSAIQTVAPSTTGNILTSNGTTWTSDAPAVVGASGQVFTSNGTFTIPSKITSIKITVVGGGGGGGGAGGSSSVASGGGGGGAAISYLTGLTPGNTLAVTVGGGGSAGTNATVNGSTGGTSSVASGTQSITTISATGGQGGKAPSSSGSSYTATGGIGSNGSLNIAGGPSMGTVSTGANLGGSGGNSILGGGGTGSTQGSGNAGRAYGGGGAGASDTTCSNTAGSAGAAGIVMFEW